MYHLPETPFSHPLRLAVLISGGGTTLDNFVARIAARTLPAEIVLVIASRSDCGGVDKARRHGLDTRVVSRQAHTSTATFSDEIFALCREARVDLVLLGGFLCLLQIPDDYLGRVMNIHPALIPAFCGAGYFGEKVHRAVHARGVKVTGCTVHFADNQYDHGPVIVQRTVPVYGADSPADIAHRVFEEECQAYPEAVNLYASARLRIIDGRVWIEGEGSTHSPAETA